MQAKINLFFRKSEQGFYSIENVFKNILPFLNKKHSVFIKELPESGHTYTSLKKNLKFVRQNRAQINHITGHINYIALVTGKLTVLTIHDMDSALKVNPLKKLAILVFWFWLPALLAKRITVISNQTKREVFKYIPFVKSKVIVVNNSLSENYIHKPKDFNLEKPQILCVGTKANKNLERIFAAVSSINCKLIIVGRLNNEKKNRLRQLNINYENLVDLSDQEILKVYVGCDILCFPSLYEGFGMPIIEAQAIGRPVLTSNTGAMLEVARDSACLVDPLDYKTIREGLEKIIANESYRKSLIKKGIENSKRFKPEEIAKQYINIYEEVMNT